MSDYTDQASVTRTILNAAGHGPAYVAEIPDHLIRTEPRELVLVVWAGGLQRLGQGFTGYGDVRLDLRFYGQSRTDNTRRAWAAHQALKHFRQQLVDGLLVHWFRPAGGPVPRRDPDVGWRFTQTSWQILSADPDPELTP